MFGYDALHLARAQFAFTVAFHIIFPAFSIGLASYLAVLEGLWLWTKRPVFLDLYRYWLRIFAVGFAMGVVSGLVMSYQFGTNWSVFAKLAGPVVGPVMEQLGAAGRASVAHRQVAVHQRPLAAGRTAPPPAAPERGAQIPLRQRRRRVIPGSRDHRPYLAIHLRNRHPPRRKRRLRPFNHARQAGKECPR